MISEPEICIVSLHVEAVLVSQIYFCYSFFCETIYVVNSNHMMFGVLGCKANSMIGRKNFAKEKDAQKEK